MATELTSLSVEIVATRQLLAAAQRKRDVVQVAEQIVELARLIAQANAALDEMNAAKVPA